MNANRPLRLPLLRRLRVGGAERILKPLSSAKVGAVPVPISSISSSTDFSGSSPNMPTISSRSKEYYFKIQINFPFKFTFLTKKLNNNKISGLTKKHEVFTQILDLRKSDLPAEITADLARLCSLLGDGLYAEATVTIAVAAAQGHWTSSVAAERLKGNDMDWNGLLY